MFGEGFGILPIGTDLIPNFKGDVYVPSNFEYGWFAYQYATTSFPEVDMTPFMLAYPRDEADIQAALAFAREKGKKVVSRSGGHQYCGMSSGGSETIVLSMDYFDQFVQTSENVVEIGPVNRLTNIAAKFNELGITIPHGECPLVNIGGHAQTGGYGHFIRGFGLLLDHITGLRIVLADGTIKDLARPNGAPKTPDEELFWGVLGGNAGSFGVVTKYQITCVRDADHPNSYGYSGDAQV